VDDEASNLNGKVWTEEEILADEDLWRVSDDSGSEQEAMHKTAGTGFSRKKKIIETVPYDPNKRNKEYYDDEKQLRDEE
jgi:hypothetical protein